MKHIYPVILLSFSLLSAEGQTALSADSNSTAEGYLEAQHLYSEGKYIEAIQSAESDTAHYANPNLHYIWAQSAEALGDSEEAMSAYERVLILSPDHEAAKVALTRIYTKTDRIELALALDDSASKPSKLKTYIGIAYGYDDNVNANPGENTLDKYYNASGSPDKVSSQIVQLNAFGNYQYPVTDALKVDTTLALFYQNAIDDHLYDMLIGSANLNLNYQISELILNLPVSYNYVRYLETHLMDKYSFMPTATLVLSPEYYFTLQGVLSKGDFADDAYALRDAQTKGVGATYYYQPQSDDLFSASVLYENQTADEKSDERFVDVRFTTFRFAWKHHFSKQWVMKTDYAIRTGEYADDIDTSKEIGADLRDDTMHQVHFKLDYLYNKTTSIYLSGQFTMVDSNYMPTEYTKNLWFIGTTMHF